MSDHLLSATDPELPEKILAICVAHPESCAYQPSGTDLTDDDARAVIDARENESV